MLAQELVNLKTHLRQAEDIIREVGVIGDAMEDSAFNSMMSINHIGSKSIAEIRQQSIHSFVQLRPGFYRFTEFYDSANFSMHREIACFEKNRKPLKVQNLQNILYRLQ